MPISSRVDVNVYDEFPTEKIPSFNIPVVLGTSGITAIKDEVTVMEGPDGIPDALDPTDKEYKMLNAIFSQQPRSDTVYLYEIDRSDYTMANLTTTTAQGSGDADITWRSQNEGNAATNVQVHIHPNPSSAHDLDANFYKSLWFEGDDGTYSYNTEDLAGGSESANDFRVISKQPDYEKVYRVIVTTGSGLKIELVDDTGDGEERTLKITLDSTYGNTPNEIKTAVENHEAGGLFKIEVGGDGTGTFDQEVDAGSSVKIPFTVQAIPQTESDGTIVTTAADLATYCNDSETTDIPLVVSATSDGGDYPDEEGPTLLTSVGSSPAELSRALDKMLETCEEQQLEKPYFLLATSYGDNSYTGEVDGDRNELSDAVGMQTMIYGTSIRDGESATDARVLANTMASSRSFVFAYKSDLVSERQYPEARLIGEWSGYDISTGALYDPMWQNLEGLPNTSYNSTEQNRIEDNAPLNSAAFTYAKAKSTPVTTGSWSTSGEYLDWQQQKDFIEEYVERKVVSLLTSRAMVRGDSRGLSELETTVEEAFKHMVNLGIVGVKEKDGAMIPMYELNFPSLDEWAEMNRAERYFIASARMSPTWAIEAFTLNVYSTLDTDEF